MKPTGGFYLREEGAGLIKQRLRARLSIPRCVFLLSSLARAIQQRERDNSDDYVNQDVQSEAAY